MTLALRQSVNKITDEGRQSVNKITDEGLTLETSANSISVRWSIYIINSVDKPNFRLSLSHRRSTTVSSETNPLYLFLKRSVWDFENAVHTEGVDVSSNISRFAIVVMVTTKGIIPCSHNQLCTRTLLKRIP